MACFNDDVQGTGCVTLAAVFAAIHVAKYKMNDLRVVMFGAGSAGTGIADQIRDAIAIESGKSKEEAIFLTVLSSRQACVEGRGKLKFGHAPLTGVADPQWKRGSGSPGVGTERLPLHS